MPIKGENGGYKYKAFINGEWHDLTLSDSPNELTEWLQSNEEWTRVKHGHWIVNDNRHTCRCSCCESVELTDWALEEAKYCPHCGAYMGVEK